MQHDYIERNYDRHRRDALSMERLTSSPMVLDIYSFCGNSGVFEFASGGDITDAIWPRDGTSNKLTPLDKLRIGKLLDMLDKMCILKPSAHLLTLMCLD
jgi:hypothetical protein